MSKKITRKQMFQQILDHTTDSAERDFLLHQIELLDAKSTKTSTKVTAEEQAKIDLRNAILSYLEDSGEALTITEMIAKVPECAGLTNQKVLGQVNILKTNGDVVRFEEKGKAYFKFA